MRGSGGETLSRHYKRKSPRRSIASNGAGNVGFCDALQKKACRFLRHIEMQLEVGCLSGNFRRLRVEQEVGILQTQPALWLVMQSARELRCRFRSFKFQK